MSNKLDPNASSPNRIRRNFQRIVQGGGVGGSLTAANNSINLSGGSISVNVAPAGGLIVRDSTYAYDLQGLGVEVNPYGGLALNVTGLGAANYSGLAVTGFQQLVSDPFPFSAGLSWFNSTTGQNRVGIAQDGSNFLSGTEVYLIFTSGAVGQQTANTSSQALPYYTQTLPSGFFTTATHTLRYTMTGVISGGVSETFTLTFTLNGTACTSTTFTNPAPTNLYFTFQLFLVGNSTEAVTSGFGGRSDGTNIVFPVTANALTLTGTITWGFNIVASGTNAGVFFSILGGTAELLS